MKSLFVIFNKGYWRSIFGPFLTLVVPFLYATLICTIYTFTNEDKPISLFPALFPSLISTIPYMLMLLIMPQAIFEIRDSILIKQLKSSSIKLWQITFIGVLYYSICTFICYIVGFSVLFLLPVINSQNAELVHYIEKQINYGFFFYVLLINIMMGISFGAMLGTVFKTTSIISLIGLTIIFFSMVLAGFSTPIILSREQLPLVWWVSYADFVRYGSTQMYEAMYSKLGAFNLNASSLFDFKATYVTKIVSLVDMPFRVFLPYDKVLNFIMPYAVFTFSASLIMYSSKEHK